MRSQAVVSRRRTSRQERGHRLTQLCENLESRLLLSVTYPDLQNWSQPSDNPALQAGMDTFAPPVDGQTPGSSNPGLAELTRAGKADDALALTGYQLSSYTGADLGKDTQFTFWSQTTGGNGTSGNGSILRVESAQASVTIPSGMLNNSMYLVWAQNNSGPSYPLAINKTEAWWTGSDLASVGQTVSVYGKNLGYYDSTYGGSNQSWIYLKPTSGAGQWVTPTAVNPYKVDFTVPSLANGTYEVWVHNGHGGKYGWSRSGDLTIQSAITWTGTIRNVKTYGAVGNGVADDTAAINAAIAASAAGDKIYFPTGTYACGTTQLITIPANRQVYGDGRTVSTLKTAIKMQGSSKLNDMAIWVPSANTVSPQIAGSQVWIQNVNMQEDHDPNVSDIKTLDCQDSTTSYVYMTSVNFTGNMVWIASNNNFFFDSCNFYGRFDAEEMICGWGASSVSVTNCTVQHYNTSDPNSNSGWGEGRFFTNTDDWAVAKNNYIGGNSVNQYVVRSGGDQNSGEQILNESSTATFEGSATGGTATTVSFNGGTFNPVFHYIMIVAGKGVGQVRDISAWNSGTQTATVTQPWNVIPDTTSQIDLVSMPERWAVYNNTQSGTPTAVSQAAHVANNGLSLFNGGYNIMVDHNNYTNERVGINFDTSNTDTRIMWNTVYNNTFTNTRWTGRSLAGPTSVTGPTILGVVWRNNTINTVDPAGAVFNEQSGGFAADSPVLDVYDKNQVTNVPVAYNLQDGTNPHDTIFYKNSFSRGTAPLSGSVGLQFGTVATDLAGKGAAGNGWSGAWASSSGSGNEHAKYFNGRQLTLAQTGYSNTGNGSGPADGAAGQTASNNRVDRFTDRALSSALTGTVWVSGLINLYEAQTTAMGVNGTGGAGSNEDPVWFGLGAANTAVLRYNGTQYTASVTANLNTTYLVLAKIELNYSGAFDRVSYWFNPNLSGGQGGLGTPTLLQQGVDVLGSNVTAAGVTVLRSAGATDTNLIDALRLSNDASNGFTAVTTGSGGTLVADYFNGFWGPVVTEPSLQGNTFSNFETTFGGDVPKPGYVLEIPTRVLAATVASGSSTTVPLPVWNAGMIDSLSWTSSSDSAWLTLAASGTVTDQNTPGSITLTCNAASLGVGTYTGTVTMTSGSQTEKARVVFTVTTPPATVTLSATDASASETGPDNGVFTVTRTGPTTSALVVNYTITGTATNTSDYTTLATSVSIPAGQTSATITVTPVDDSLIEGSETVILTLASGSYSIGSPSTGTVTIADNDVPAITISATDANASETGPDTGTFTVTRTGSGPALTTGALTVNYTISGTATNTSDYTTLTTSVVIANGQTSATITVTPVDDALVEGSETVILTLASGSGYTIGAPSTGTVTIADNDSSGGGTLISEYFSYPGYSESQTLNGGNGGTNWATNWSCRTDGYGGRYSATNLSNATTGYQNTGNDASTGSDRNGGSDGANYANGERTFTGLGSTVWMSWLFNGGSSSFAEAGFAFNGATYDVTQFNANSNRVWVQNNQLGLTSGGTSHTASISDNGSSTELFIIKITMNYSGSYDRIQLWRNPADVSSEGAMGTATLLADGNDAFGSSSDLLTKIALRQSTSTERTDAIRISNDASNGFTLVTQGQAASSPTVTLSATDPNASETGPDNGVFTVTRTGSTTNALVVNYTITGTATNTSDYSTLATSVSIPAGQTSATITVTPVDDALVEGSETVILTLGSGSYTIGSPSTGTVTIADNDGGTVFSEYLNGYGSSNIAVVSAANSYGLSGGTSWPSAWYRGAAYGADNEYPQYLAGVRLTSSATGYQNTNNNNGASDGAMGQTATGGNRNDRFVARATGGLTGTVWISGLVEFTVSAWNYNQLSLDTNSSGAGVTNFLKIENEGNASNPIAVLGYNGTTYNLAWSAGRNLTENVAYLFMMKVVMNSGGTSDNVSVWINPANVSSEAAMGTADITASGADVFGTTFDYIGFGAAQGNVLDALRISNDATNGFRLVAQGQ